jgi:hypothetical protein
LGIKLGLRPLCPTRALYIQEEAQPCAILRNNRKEETIRKGDNKTGDNSGLIIARDNEKGENNSEPIRGELKHETTSP